MDVQVLSTVPVLFNYWAQAEHAADFARFLNDDIAAVVRQYPKRFIGLGTLPMQSAHLAVAELTRCVTELGLCGIQIGSSVNKANLDDPMFEPVFAVRHWVFVWLLACLHV